jgi:hypothetical protein
MNVLSEHNDERSVGMSGDTAGPSATTRQVVDPCLRLQRRWIDAFDPTRRAIINMMAVEKNLSRRAQDDHRGAVRITGDDLGRFTRPVNESPGTRRQA